MTEVSENKSGLLSFAVAMMASVLSSTGTSMTQFALIAWAYQATGSAAASGVLGTSSFAAMMIASIFAGALVDRLRRKRLIIGSDILTAVTTLGILLLFRAGHLGIWSMAVYGVVLGVVSAIQFPAYMASITAMVPEEQQGRANGMFQTAWSISLVVAPALAGLLLGWIGMSGVLLINLFTFLVMIVTVACLNITQPPIPETKSTIWQDSVDGFRYLFARMSLFGFVLVLTSFNFAYGTYEGIFRPMLLAFTHNNTEIAGWALAGWGIGNVVSGVFMTIWKGPKNRVPITLISWALCGFSGFIIGGLGRSLLVWLIGGFFQGVFNNIAIIFTYGIWQSKVDPAFQGRVFSIIKLVSQITIPISIFAATEIADHYAEPALHPGGSLVGSLGGLLGTGDGAGMSLVLIVSGLIFGVIFPLGMFLIKSVRHADKETTESGTLVDAGQEVTV